MAGKGRYALNKETRIVHDTKTADERCNLDDARNAKNLQRMSAGILFRTIDEEARVSGSFAVLQPCRRCMS